MDALTLADALELFKLPRTLGQTDDGHPIKVAIGRFGPYVQYGAKKYVSIKDDDPYTIKLPRALELIRAKEVARREPHHPRFPGSGHPGAERPLRAVHHRPREERQDSEGPRTEDADARGVQGLHRRSAGARQRALRQIAKKTEAARAQARGARQTQPAPAQAGEKGASSAAKRGEGATAPASRRRAKDAGETTGAKTPGAAEIAAALDARKKATAKRAPTKQ